MSLNSSGRPKERRLTQDREPVFNAPWPAVVVVAVIILGYGLQTLVDQERLILRYAFSPASFEAGARDTVVTALFLHGGWLHALLNGGFALAFAPPVARLFGERVPGVAMFFLFYLLCGVIGNLGFSMVHPGSSGLLVGASGAVAGLMGAASRLMAGQGCLGPLFSRPVASMALAWIAVNLIVAVVGFAPGLGQASVAWEAHLAGYAAGLILVGPAASLLRRA
jgi:membrane associated rhomboid family serine protease